MRRCIQTAMLVIGLLALMPASTSAVSYQDTSGLAGYHRYTKIRCIDDYTSPGPEVAFYQYSSFTLQMGTYWGTTDYYLMPQTQGVWKPVAYYANNACFRIHAVSGMDFSGQISWD